MLGRSIGVPVPGKHVYRQALALLLCAIDFTIIGVTGVKRGGVVYCYLLWRNSMSLMVI